MVPPTIYAGADDHDDPRATPESGGAYDTA
jgi:hypothetical protein